MKQILNGVTDEYVYFEMAPGQSSFTVYGARDGGSAAAFTTPTVAEVDATNMPGQYRLLVDEQTTMTAGNLTEELRLHISAGGFEAAVSVLLVNPLVAFRQQLTEGYAADGSAPTLEQAIFFIQQVLSEFAISDTSLTVKKLDGSTTAFVLTLDSASSPSSVTRSS
jgi:hypothetical protein